MLRNVLELALQIQETPDYMRLVEIYGSGCVRLVRMLKKEGRDRSWLERYLEGAIELVIREVIQLN